METDTPTSATRMEYERTSIITVVLQRGAFTAEDTFDSRSFNKAVIDSEDVEPGTVACLLPVKWLNE
jgi:hypothetical protein